MLLDLFLAETDPRDKLLHKIFIVELSVISLFHELDYWLDVFGLNDELENHTFLFAGVFKHPEMFLWNGLAIELGSSGLAIEYRPEEFVVLRFESFFKLHDEAFLRLRGRKI
jgi:hypothetical protein